MWVKTEADAGKLVVERTAVDLAGDKPDGGLAGWAEEEGIGDKLNKENGSFRIH